MNLLLQLHILDILYNDFLDVLGINRNIVILLTLLLTIIISYYLFLRNSVLTERQQLIQDAIDKAFEEIAAVSNGQRKERQVVDSTVMGRSFDEDTTARLKEILLPSKTRIPVDNAYGMFIGYTIGLDPNQYTNDQYRKAVQDKMVLDIQNHVQYIVDKINSLNLSRSSFYVYVLPLNKALEDKKEIMDRLLGGDD